MFTRTALTILTLTQIILIESRKASSNISFVDLLLKLLKKMISITKITKQKGNAILQHSVTA